MEKAASPELLKNWRFQQALYRAYYDAYVRARLIYETELEERAMDRLRWRTTSGAAGGNGRGRKDSRRGRDARGRRLAQARLRTGRRAVREHQDANQRAQVQGHWRRSRRDARHDRRAAEQPAVAEGAVRRAAQPVGRSRAAKPASTKSSTGRIPGRADSTTTWASSTSQPHLVVGPGFERDPAFLESSHTGFAGFGPMRASWKDHAEALLDAPLRMRYEGLDPAAQYKMRVVYGGDSAAQEDPLRGQRQDRSPSATSPRKFPYGPVEFDIPREATRGGELNLSWYREPRPGRQRPRLPGLGNLADEEITHATTDSDHGHARQSRGANTIEVCDFLPGVDGELVGTAAALMAGDVRVGAAAANIEADDSMVIGGGIGPGKAVGPGGPVAGRGRRAREAGRGQSGHRGLRRAVRDARFRRRGACSRSKSRPAFRRPACWSTPRTRTMRPRTATVHGYVRDDEFVRRVARRDRQSGRRGQRQAGRRRERVSVQAGRREHRRRQQPRAACPTTRSGGAARWTTPLRHTGPFDPQLPVLAFRGADQKLRALIYNHSTHTIGTRKPGVRSPSFYGLAAQELETELGCTVSFLEGASGSTHNITGVPVDEAVRRMKKAVSEALAAGRAAKRDEAGFASSGPSSSRSARSTSRSKTKRSRATAASAWPPAPTASSKCFATCGSKLKGEQGKTRETVLQAIVIGDVAIVGVPAEYFTIFGVDIKRRSPFRNTVRGRAGQRLDRLPAESRSPRARRLSDLDGPAQLRRARHRRARGRQRRWGCSKSWPSRNVDATLADAQSPACRLSYARAGSACCGLLQRWPSAAADRSRLRETPLSPDEELATFELADERLTIELVAGEPQLDSPVAISLGRRRRGCSWPR